MAFKGQTTKWEPLTLSHTSRAILTVHKFMTRLLEELCPDRRVKAELWNSLSLEQILERYKKTMDYAKLPLHIERSGALMTLNHNFNSALQEGRSDRLRERMRAVGVQETKKKAFQGITGQFWTVLDAQLQHLAENKSNTDQVCEDSSWLSGGEGPDWYWGGGVKSEISLRGVDERGTLIVILFIGRRGSRSIDLPGSTLYCLPCFVRSGLWN